MKSLKEREEVKRDCRLGARERWRLVREASAWAEAQAAARRNTPRRCLAEQARKNAPLAGRGRTR
jgi:hypothetical protein